MAIVGKEALTTVRLEDGTRVNVPKDAVVPASADQDDVARLIKEGFLEEVEDVYDEDVADVTDTEVSAEEELLQGGVNKILEEVGEDADLAGVLLALETGDGGKDRKSLVKGLQAVIDAANASGAGSGDEAGNGGAGD